MADLVDWQRIEAEYYRNPIRMELVKQVIPLLGAAIFIGVMLGYGWAMKAFGG
jgi:hypothetical protein